MCDAVLHNRPDTRSGPTCTQMTEDRERRLEHEGREEERNHGLHGFREEKHDTGLSHPQRLDVSELILMNADKEFVLTKGRAPSSDTRMARLVRRADGFQLLVRAGDTFEAGDQAYQVVEVDAGKGRMQVRRVADGKEETIGREQSGKR